MHIWPEHLSCWLIFSIYAGCFSGVIQKSCITGISQWDIQESQAIKNCLSQQSLQEPFFSVYSNNLEQGGAIWWF